MAPRPRQQQQEEGGSIPFPGDAPEVFALEQFAGLNTQATRSGISDQECSWLENVMPIGANNARSLYAEGSSIYTAAVGVTIIYYFPFNIGATTYIAVFLDNGKADQVNINSHAVTAISAAVGTFYDGTALPACAQWGNSGIVIISQLGSTNDTYWAWDGALASPGGASPTWLNGGTPTTMPTGVRGTYIETYLSRVIIDNGNTKLISAPANGATFSGAAGGLTITAADSFLKRAFIASKQANGFLYSFGDSSINVLSNIVSSGSPIVTTLNNQNVDPQVGTPWPGTIQTLGNSIVFANTSGVYELRGGAAVKVSDNLDGLFITAALSQPLLSLPKAAVATIFGIRCYMLLLSLLDPFTGLQRNALCMWNGKKWWIGSQLATLTYVATQEFDSLLTAWGTSGTNLIPLFQTASSTLTKIIQSKLVQGRGGFITNKQVLRAYSLITNNSASAFTGTMQIDTLSETGVGATVLNLSSSNQLIFVNNSNQQLIFVNGSSQTIIFSVVALGIFGQDAQGATGGLIGFTARSTSPDFTVISLLLEYQRYAPIGG